MAFKSTQWKDIDGERWFRFSSSFDHFRYWWGNITTTILIILLLAMMIYAYSNLEAIKTNPLSYYAKKISERSGEQVSFTCYQGDPSREFNFNSTSIWITPKERVELTGQGFNISDLQFPDGTLG